MQIYTDDIELAKQYASFLAALGGVSITVLTLVLTLSPNKDKPKELNTVLVTSLIVATFACFTGAHLMMRIAGAFCFFVTLLLLLTPLARAQHSLSVPDRVERTIKEKEPSWNLVSVMVRKTKEENYSYFRLKYEEQEVGIHVNEYEEPARISPNSLLTAAPRERTLLKDIGDEAYLLSSSPYDRIPKFDVVFRKGKVRVTIEAGSPVVAKRIATYLADALPPPNNGMHPTPR